MTSVPSNILAKKYNWTSILLWSFGIALLIFALIWLRIGYLDPYLNDNTDTILFGMPHILMASWGAIIGFSLLNNNKVSLAPIRYPFLTLLLAVIFFDIIFSFWGAYIDHHLNLDPNRSYIFSVIYFSIGYSWVALMWIMMPFLIGYFMTKFVRYAINYMCCKKQI